MKIRVNDEDGFELSTFCRQLKLESPDHQKYVTDCANTEGIFRIIQSIPSPKAEPFKRWLEKYEKEHSEETPLGLILCAGKASEQIELLQLDKSVIKVAEYMTELPKRELLEQKLHKAVELARKRLEAKPA